jgi:hypothetical protein
VVDYNNIQVQLTTSAQESTKGSLRDLSAKLLFLALNNNHSDSPIALEIHNAEILLT